MTDKKKPEIEKEPELTATNDGVENADSVEATSEDENPVDEEENKYNELNDRYLRLHAEFDNYRRRSNREKVELISSANANLLKDLLPILDNFERGIANNNNATDINVVKEGFSLIFNLFNGIVEAKGVKKMDCKNQPFDSELHEAIANLTVEDAELKGKVVEVVENGYLLNDKVVRFAKVIVGQ